MTKSTTDELLTAESAARERNDTSKSLPESNSLTEVLRLALISCPGEAGALGMTSPVREAAERQAAQFCQARPADAVASATGQYRARVYELADETWGVVVWYEAVG